jgi:hypothetical protein
MAINSQDWETSTFSTRSEYRLKNRRMFSQSGHCSSLPPRRIVLSLGQGKWQAGLAAVGLHELSEGSLLIGIFTWQHSFAGEDSRPGAQGVTFRPIVALSIGGGYYVRSSGIWSFDIVNNKTLIPVGVGFGKVFKTGNAIVNVFIEPQFTAYHDGTGLPSFQLFAGLNFQFRKKTE